MRNHLLKPVARSATPAVDIIADGLRIYLDSTNSASYPGTGNVWYDLSGLNNHFTWNSVSFTSGSPSYFSTSSNRKCDGPASNSLGITNTSGYTIFLIDLQNTLKEAQAVKFFQNNLSGASGRAISLHNTWSDNNIYFDQGGCCGSDTRVNTSGGTTTTWNTYTFRRVTNSSTRNIFKNGSLLVTNTATAATINPDSRAVNLGNTDEFTAWDARLGGFIVYNRGLSDAEVLSVHNTIKARYGIA